MAPPAPSEQALRRARASWLQSGEDLRVAGRRRRQAPLESAYLSFQSALNALSTVCYLHGEYRIPNFSAVRLAALCEQFDARFASLREACAALEQVQNHSPFAQRAAGEGQKLAALAREAAGHAGRVRKTVRGYLKANRLRFFAP